MSGALLFCPREMFNEGRQERQEDNDRKEQRKADAIIQA